MDTRETLRAAPANTSSATTAVLTCGRQGSAAPADASASMAPHDGRYNARSARRISVGTSTLETGASVTAVHARPISTPGPATPNLRAARVPAPTRTEAPTSA